MSDIVSIIGLGLIGGSLGMALKKHTPGITVKGYSRRPETRSLAITLGAVDMTAETLAGAVKDARLVAIATPVMTTRTILKEMAACAAGGTIVTDTGSTKAAVMEWAAGFLPRTVQFIGGHPMAGKEKAGIEFAEADLFRNCTYCLMPSGGASPEALFYVKSLVATIGARPVIMEAARHDRLVAGISHLPFLLSVILMELCSRDADWPEAAALASSGFRDMTRLASGDPEMYRDICLTNAAEIGDLVEKYIKALQDSKASLADRDRLQKLFSRAREATESWLKGR